MQDIIGAYDIIGTELAGDHDMMALLAGADSPLANAAPAQQVALARQIAMRGSPAVVVNRAPTKSRLYPQGFGPTTIAAGATVNIIVQPQVAFKGKRLVIPSDFAGAVLVNDIKIGNNSQLPSSNPLPGRAFTEMAFGVNIDFDTAQISQQISMSITNTSGASITFSACIFGIAVQ